MSIKQIIILLFIFINGSLFSQNANFQAVDSTQCPGNLFILTANNTTYPSSAYSWQITNPTGVVTNYSGNDTIGIVLSSTGLYDVTLTVTSGGTASVTRLDYLTVYAKPSIIYTVSPTTGCSPMNVVFNGSCTAGSGSIVSYSINTANGFVSSAEDFSYTYSNTTSGNLTFKPKATITNSVGCFDTLTLATIIVRPSPSLSSPTNPNAVCSGSTFNYIPTSSTAGCTFSWSRASNIGIVQGASSGTGNISETLTLVNPTGSNVSVTYVVTTTALNGCQTQQNVVVSVRALPAVSISPSSLTICNGSSGTLTATGTPSGGTYTWSNSLGSATTATVSTAGTYSVTYSAGGCSSAPANATVTVTSAPTWSSPAINIAETSGTTNNDGTICSGGSVTLTANPAAGGGTYLWSPGGQTTSSITVAPSATTTYTVTYTLGCPSAPTSTQIIVRALPTNNYLSSVTSACSAPVTTNYTSTATAPSGSTISSTNWTFTGGTPNSGTGLGPLLVTYNASGVYGISLTSTSSDGCVSTTNYSNAISISSTPAPTSSFSVSPSTSQCLGSNFTFTYTGTGADSIRWDLGNGAIIWTQENVPLTYGATQYLTPGSYVISMTPWTTIAGSPPQLGCSGSVTTQFITVKGPKASFTLPTVNCTNQFSRTFTNTTTGTTGSTTYAWSFPSGTPATANTSGPHTVTWAAQGSYTVTLTATDASTGCPATNATATVNVNSNTGADFSANFTSVCLGASVIFTNTTPSPQYNGLNQNSSSTNTQWDWNSGNGVTFIASSPTLRGTPRTRGFTSANGYAPGQYGIAMLNIDNNNCRDTIIKPNYITVHGVIASLSVADTLCAGQAFQPIDNSTAPMSSIASRVWNWGDGTANTTGNNASPTHTYANPGPYTITLTITDNSGLIPACSTVVTKNVFVRKPTANFSVNRNFICNNQTVVVSNNSTGVGLSTYNWSATNASPATASGSSFGTFTFTQQGNQSITLTVTDNLGCVDDTTIAISVFDVLAAANPPTATFSCFNSSPPNQVTFTNLSTNNVDVSSAQWDFGNGQTSTSWEPSTTYTLPGTYNVLLTVTSLTGCTSTQQVSIITVGGPSATLDITNASLTGCTCYNATISITTNNVSSVSFFPYGSGSFSSITPNSTQNITETYCNTGTTPITVTPAVYISGNAGCNGLINFNETITINPKAAITAMTSTVCSQTAFSVTPVNVTNGVIPTGTTYSWSAPVAAGITGLASGTSATSISGTLTNTTNAPINVVYTVTPTSGACAGSTFTVTVTVNPRPAITAMTSTVCSQTAFSVTPVNTTNGIVPSGTTYSWSAPVAAGITGLASGTSATSISGTLTNTTNAPINVVYTVTPTSGACAGSTFTVTVTVNPRPAITAMTSTVCSQTAFSVTPVNTTNGIVPSGTTYSWSAPVAAGITGLASGTSATSISGTLTNTTNAPINVVYTVTPTSGACAGSTFTVTVTVNPGPAITAMTSTACSQTTFSVTPVNVTNGVIPTGTTYSWPAPVAAGITGLASGTSATSISGTLTNTTNAPINVVYTVTPTSGACAGSTFTVTVTVNPRPAITAMTSTVCSQTAFSVTPVNTTNGIVPTGTTYSWSTPVAAGITGLASGTSATSISGTLTNTTNAPINVVYTVTPTSGTCAGSTFTVTVTVNPRPAITAMTSTVCSQTAFSVTPVNTTNGIVPTGTTYSWSAPVAAGITGLASGTSATSISGTLTNTTNAPINVVYTVTPTSGACAGSTFTVTVTVNPRPTYTASFTNPTVCNANDGTITLSSLQANTSYSYSLNGGSAIAVISNGTGQITILSLAASTYSIVITNTSSGCSSAAQSVSLTNPGAPNVNDITDQVLCGGSYILPVITGTNLSGNQSYYTGINGTGTAIVAGTAISTSQTIYIYGSTPGGCSDQETFTVTINPLPTISGTVSVCVGSTVQLTGSGTANASSPWTSSTPANATVNSTGLVTGVAVGSTTITYTNNNGCLTTAVVTVNPLPTFTATPTNPTLCNGTNGSILLTGLQNNTAYTYSLNGATAVSVTSSASGQVTISSLGAGTFTVTVTLASIGCISLTQTISLTNPGAPNVNDITDQVLCGGSYILPVITGTNLSGNQSYYTGINGTGTPLAAGTAISTSQTIYIYGSTPGGCSDQETFTVTINPLPTVSGTLTVCVGSTVQLTGSGTANASSPWTSSTPANATVNSTGLVTGVAVGSTTITYTDNNGCLTTAVVTVNPLPTFTATPTNPTLCNGTNGSILLTGLQNNTAYTYSLNGSAAVAVTSSASGQVTISSLGASTYSIVITNTSSGCSSAAQSVSLTNPGAPNVNDITDQVLCGGSYTLPVITGTNLNGNQAYYTQPNGPNGTGSVLTGSISTSQTVYIYASTPGGCSDEETFTVTINALPTISGTLTVCVGSTVQLTGSGTANASSPWTSSTPANATVNSTGLVTGVAVGSTTITYTDNNGCLTTAVVTVNPLPTFTATPTNPTLCNGTNGSILLTGLQNNTAYTYSLNGSAAVAVTSSASGQVTISSLGAGTFTVTVTLASTDCISLTQTITLTNPGAPNVNDITDQVLCGGSYTLPVITGTNLNGNQAYYTQPNGPNGTGSVLTGSISTSQTVYIYASTPGGCSDEETFTVTINVLPTISGTLTVCVGSTVQLTGSGTANASSPWTSSTPANATVNSTGLVTGVAVGSTTITYTDNNGCLTTAVVTVNPLPTFTATPTSPTLCNGTNGSILLTGLQNNTAYTYSLNGAAAVSVTSSASGQVTISSLGSGTYTITVILVSTGCVSTTQTVSLTNPGAPNVNDITDQVLCGGSYTLPVITGTNLNGNQAYYTGTNGTGSVLTGSINTSQTVYIYASTPGGCSDEETFTITIQTIPTLSVGTTLCVGNTLQLSASTAGTWVSNSPSIASVIPATGVATGLLTGNLTFTFTDSSTGCTATTSTVSVNATPTANAGADVTICASTGFVSLSGSFGGSASSVNWTGGNGGVFSSPTSAISLYTFSSTDISTGSVWLYITTNDPAGDCSFAKDSILISINPSAIINAGVDQVTCGTTSVSLSGTVGGAGTSATWSTTNGTGTFSSNNSLNASYTPSIGDISTVYINIVLTSNDPLGPCPAVTDTVVISVDPPATANAGLDFVSCSNTPINLNGLFGGSASTGIWSASSNPVVNNPTTSNVIYTPSVAEVSAGSVILTFTTNDPAGSCLAVSDQVQISFSTPAIVNAGNDTTICSGSTIGLNGTFGGLATSATWSSAGTPPGVFTGSSLYTPSAAEITAGIATLTYTTNNPAGPCPAVSDQKIITINPTPTVAGLTPITVCSGTSLNHALSGVVSSNYTWIAADNNQTTGESTTLQTTSSITDVIINQTTIDQVLVYTITPTAVGSGCVGAPQTLTVTVKPTPTLIDPADQTLCANTSTLAVPFTSNLPGTTFAWTISPTNLNIGLSNGTGNSIPSFTALNSFTTTINPIVTVTPTSNSSCAGTPQTFNYTILPISTVVDPLDQVICAGTLTSSITFIGSDPATIYNWTSNNVTIGAGLSSPGAGNIPAFTGINNGITDITSTFTVTPSLNGCLGTPQTFTITVKPLPVMQTPSNQTVCVGNSTAQVVFASSILGTTYTWTNTNSNVGLPAASAGNVTFIPSFVSQNSTNIIDTANVVVTPTFNGCSGSTVSFQFIVNPILQVTPITNVVYCAGDVFPGVSFTGNVPTANYSWSTDNVSIGFPVSGQSNVPGINSFTTQNSGSLTQIANVTVTPSLPGCQGTPFTFTITIKPLPTVFIAPLTQAHCHGSSTIPVDFTGNLDPVVTYTWSQDNTSISSVLLGTGTNDIASFTATNTGLVSETSTFIVVPTYNGCTGVQDTFSITVNPIPTVANILDQNWCAGQPSDPVNFTGSLGSTATYNWTQTNQYIGNTIVPTVGDIPSFTTQNLTTIIQTDTITVTPSFNGCNGIPEVFVITVRPTPTVYPVADQSLCVYTFTNPVVFNGNMGSVATYAWTNNNTVINSNISSGNDSIPSFQVQNPGNTIVVATITVTPEAYGCFGIPETFTISSVDPIPTVIPTADITLCAGSQTGTIDFQPNDPTITYHWTNDNTSIGLASAGTTDIANFQLQNSGIINQTAHVIVTPEYNGCFGLSDTFDITVKPIPNVFITPLYDSLCANQNTSYVDFTGDIAGTNFSWINSNTSIGLLGSGTGDIASFIATNISNNIETATITVTPNFNGCSGTPQTTTITVNPISTVVLPTQPIFYCHGDSITDIIFNGNNPGTIYQWTNNNTAINLPSSGVGNILSFPVNNTDVVNYEAIIAVQPVLNGCPGTLDSFKIIVKPIPTVYTPANQFLCANQASALVDFQGNMTDSTVFNWFNTNVSIGLLNPTLTGGTGDIPSFVATNVGQFTQVADVIVVPTLNGCIGVADTFQYTVYPISTVNLVNDTVCTGDFVNQLNFVGSNPTATYEWTCYNTIGLNPLTGFDSIPGFTAFNSGTTPQDGLIVVTPFVGGCPGINDTLHIVVNPRPIITPSPDQIVCANDVTAPIVFGSNILGTTYTWENSNISIGLGSSGTTDIASFTSINTDATGLVPQNGTIIVTPFYNGCAGLNDTLSITVNPLPVVNAGLDTTLCFGQYLLLTGSGTAITYSWDNGAINGVPYYPSATTLFTVVGTDNNLCQNTDQILVTYLLDLPPVVSAGPDTAICFGQPITLNGSGNALVYNWNNNVVDGQSFNPAQTDTYIVIGTAANGCIASDTMELIVHPLPIISINVVDSILCAGEQALLWGSGAVTYIWDNNVIDNVPFVPTETDNYVVIGYDQFGCTDTADITVVVNPMPNVLFSSDMNFGGCLPFSPTFTDLTGANGNGPTSASVMWYFGNGASSNQLISVTNIYDSYGCYDVTLVSTTAEACTDSLTLQDFVCVNELVASFTPDPLSQPISNPVFEFTNTSVNATEFQWFFGDGTESDFVSTNHTYDSVGCYQVVLVASAQDGCTDTTVQVVCVKDEVIIYVPNSFTPDGDRLNDIFLPILTAGYRPGTYEFAIYNRWGEQFFYTEDVDQGWDGTFKGNEVQVGTYTYTIKFKSSMDNNVYTYNGHVNLIR